MRMSRVTVTCLSSLDTGRNSFREDQKARLLPEPLKSDLNLEHLRFTFGE